MKAEEYEKYLKIFSDPEAMLDIRFLLCICASIFIFRIRNDAYFYALYYNDNS